MTEMKGISELEQIILVETGEMGYPLNNLYNDVKVFNKDASHAELCGYMCTIIGSMLVEEKISLQKSFYQTAKDFPDSYEHVSSRELTEEEKDLVLKHPEKWDDKDIFSATEVIELIITDTGLRALEELC